jgi:hypothetical protein
MVTFASGTPWRLSSSSTPVRSAEMTASFHSVWITPMRKADAPATSEEVGGSLTAAVAEDILCGVLLPRVSTK